jgi:hypothetical protein
MEWVANTLYQLSDMGKDLKRDVAASATRRMHGARRVIRRFDQRLFRRFQEVA